MSDAPAIPKPVLDPSGLNAEFYERCAAGTLCFQRCRDCGTWRHIPRIMCAKCASPSWEWTPSSGRGRIYSWTVTHQAPHPAFAAETPYAVVVVEMEEGVRLVSRLRGLPPDAIELDLPVEVEFEKLSESVALPIFHPRQPGE
ncbi:MAG: OB-fold domain-containing protein [Myxococcota bacterium]